MYTRRPECVKDKSTEIFSKIKDKPQSSWNQNGKSSYLLCKIDEFSLFKFIVQKNPTQKEFRILDVGAGNYKFGQTLKEKIDHDSDLPKDIEVIIYSIGGEKHQQSIIEKFSESRCSLYEFGSFEIENILQSFHEKRIELTNSIDLVLSSFCLQHLVDPLGTLEQLYLLVSKNGYILSNGFHAKTTHSVFDKDPNGFLASLLYKTEDPILVHPCNDNYGLNHFLLKKTHEVVLPILSLEYSKLEVLDSSYNKVVGSKAMIVFDDTKLPLPKLDQYVDYLCEQQLFGHEHLYRDLKDYNCFYNECPEDGGINYGECLKYMGEFSEINAKLSE